MNTFPGQSKGKGAILRERSRGEPIIKICPQKRSKAPSHFLMGYMEINGH